MTVTTESLRLPFGASGLLIPGLKAAWGARLIVTQDGATDLPWDRQGGVGDETLLNHTFGWLNDGALAAARQTLSHVLRERRVLTSAHQPVWLYEDRQGVIFGDPQGSHGYVYLAAYLFDALPAGHPTKGAERLIARMQELREGKRPARAALLATPIAHPPGPTDL